MAIKHDSLGRMKGGVRKRGRSGSWSFVLDLGMQPAQRCNGCNHREWVAQERFASCPKCGGALRDTRERRQVVSGGFATRQEAMAARTERLHAKHEGTVVAPTRVTLAEYLRDKWLPAIRGEGLKRTTLASYEDLAEHHLIGPAKSPYLLGATPLQKVTRDAIRGHYAHLSSDGRVDGRGGLSPASVRRVHATLSRALNDAVEGGWIVRNPAHGVAKRLPKAGGIDPTVKAWTLEHLDAFLGSVSGDRLFPLWRVLAMTGMRRGEALALRWGDVDLANSTIAVRRSRTVVGGDVIESTPKSNRGRLVHVDAETVALLRSHAEMQAQEMVRAGNRWAGQDYVFANRDGSPLHPNRVYRIFAEAVRKAALPSIPLHGLRHSHATLALQAGVNPKIVQDRLGHSTVAITLDIYSHAVPQLDADAAATVASLLNGVKDTAR